MTNLKALDTTAVQRNDIVQITRRDHYWFPALVVVTEVKSWGVQGYTVMVDNTDAPNDLAYIRINSTDYEFVGRAVIVTDDGEGDS